MVNDANRKTPLPHEVNVEEFVAATAQAQIKELLWNMILRMRNEEPHVEALQAPFTAEHLVENVENKFALALRGLEDADSERYSLKVLIGGGGGSVILRRKPMLEIEIAPLVEKINLAFREIHTQMNSRFCWALPKGLDTEEVIQQIRELVVAMSGTEQVHIGAHLEVSHIAGGPVLACRLCRVEEPEDSAAEPLKRVVKLENRIWRHTPDFPEQQEIPAEVVVRKIERAFLESTIDEIVAAANIARPPEQDLTPCGDYATWIGLPNNADHVPAIEAALLGNPSLRSAVETFKEFHCVKIRQESTPREDGRIMIQLTFQCEP
ncbi:MAG: hypothetical protein HOE53_03130 [Candidatus Magasanikbacteria bacterium]|jgi:hypothetical protein|nr:hypothetical protein [Candidatus Magasanikbacteria bacterium]